MNDNSILARIIVIILVITIVGGNVGLSVSGTLEKPEVSEDQPGITSFFSWCWSGMSFFFAMMLFSVPDMPEWISAIFLVGFLLVLWILLKWVRGSQSGV